ncbi:hypothetical protein ES332_A05G174100v1 [Gossypium tomentosum]|uniref:C3H1-type domain-containing protein n=1 Tax=Gossypium tomentosum TaxID=34277 RepID=A0A5D2QGA0_GOSTO|nr:hypothetical protein ES332_A05G174100v1 [Gossypium tomentosum]
MNKDHNLLSAQLRNPHPLRFTTSFKILHSAAMPLSTPAAVPRADKDDERRTALTTKPEFNSSDMEIDDDDEEERGEELQVSSKRNDGSNIMESKGHGGHLGSDPLSAPGRSEMRIPSKTLYVGESSASFNLCSLPDEPWATQREDLCKNYNGSKYPISGKWPANEKAIQEYGVNGQDARVIFERKAHEDHHEQHTRSKVNEIMYEATNLISVDGKEIAINDVISILGRYHSGVGVSSHGFEQKSEQMGMQTENNKRSIKSRSSAQQTSTGSLYPGAEFNSENKRPALICDFFARGWCVKGSSCKFIHIKDSGTNPRQQSEEDAAVADEKIAVQLDEGIQNTAEKSRPHSPGSSDRLPSSARNGTASSPLIHSKDKSIGTSLGSQQFQASTDDSEPSKDVRQTSIGQSLPADNYVKPGLLSDRGSSTFRNGFLPKHIPYLSGSVTSLGNTYKENQKYRVSTWLASLPFSSSSSACSVDAQKMLKNDREHHTSHPSSLLQGSSPFSGFEPENFPATDIAKDPLHFTEYRIKISSDDWEPSVPFRPSLFITFGSSSPRRQYDPLCDSIDLSNVGERSLKFSFSSQGPSLLDVAYPPTYDDSTSAGPLVPACNADKIIASCHGRCVENLVNNNYLTSGKDSTTDANDGTSAADMQNGTLVKEEISSVASHVKDISKTSKTDTDRDARHRRDGFRCKKDLKVDRVREKNEIDIEHKADGEALKESKAMRHFHAALVDLIKELLKPTWREGHLSKDAHNRIVKKAVNKVIGTMQPHQIPLTFESVKQYLSASQSKIARLVQDWQF